MRGKKLAGGVIFALTVLFSTVAFAGSKPGPLILRNGADLNGKHLPPGSYQVKWQGNGPEVQVQVLHDKQVVATAPAKVEQLPEKGHDDAAVIDTTNDARNLVEARFAGRKYKLVFTPGAAQARNSSSGSTQTNR